MHAELVSYGPRAAFAPFGPVSGQCPDQCASLILIVVLNPMDTVKVRMQTEV